jgi:hypothetical protein
MRSLALLAVPALLLLVAPASAVAPCVGAATCNIQGSGVLGFLPPVAVVPSWGVVTFTGLDESPHINVEGVLGSADPCFIAAYAGADGVDVAFAVQGGQLVATQDDVSRVCSTAQMTSAGAVVGYICTLHPLFMKGALVVLA